MAHHHNHHHHHSSFGPEAAAEGREKKLLLTIFLNIGITALQIVGGILAGSLALVGDALHNLSDVVSLVISYIAARLSLKKGSAQTHTYGFKRAEIIAALLNGLILAALAVYLLARSIERLFSPEPVGPNLVILLGLLGIALNGISAWILFKDSKGNLNVRSAFIHLLADTLTSVGVVVGGTLIRHFEIYWIDAAISCGISIYLILISWRLIAQTLRIVMQFTPEGIDIAAIKKTVGERFPGCRIHHIHLWQMNDRDIYMEAHLGFDHNYTLSESEDQLKQIRDLIYREFAVTHFTLQQEYCPEEGNCPLDNKYF